MGTLFGIVLGLAAWTVYPFSGQWTDFLFFAFACMGSMYVIAVEPLSGVKIQQDAHARNFDEIKRNTDNLMKEFVSRGGSTKDLTTTERVDSMSAKAIEREADKIIHHLRDKKEKAQQKEGKE